MISKTSYYITAEPGKYLQDKSGRNLGIAAWLAIGISPEDYQNIGKVEERTMYFPDENRVLYNKETEELIDSGIWIVEDDLPKWEEIDKPIESEEDSELSQEDSQEYENEPELTQDLEEK